MPPTGGNAFTSGVFDFDPTFQYDTPGPSPDGQLTILTDPSGLTGISIDVLVLETFESYITVDNTNLLDRINPLDLQNTDIVNDAGDIELARFRLIDGRSPNSGMGNDVDEARTNISQIVFGITNPQNLRQLAIYIDDGASGTEFVGGGAYSFW